MSIYNLVPRACDPCPAGRNGGSGGAVMLWELCRKNVCCRGGTVWAAGLIIQTGDQRTRVIFRGELTHLLI